LILLLSGEGKTDIGECGNQAEQCGMENFVPGPMAIFIDQLVEKKFQFSCLEAGNVRFINEHTLAAIGKGLVNKKKLHPPGKKKKKETLYFELNARALAVKAKSLMAELKGEVIAVLFRDADGTASTIRGLYEAKRESMLRGFAMEGYDKGIPMVPKPKSEAWILCAVKENPYNHCNHIENISGKDNSPNALKKQLDKALGEHVGAKGLAEMAKDGRLDVHRIDMPSMNWFKERLDEVLA